jgi:hypothetical protein
MLHGAALPLAESETLMIARDRGSRVPPKGRAMQDERGQLMGLGTGSESPRRGSLESCQASNCGPLTIVLAGR